MGTIEIALVILFIFFIVFPIIIIGFMLTGSRRTSKVINELIKEEEQTPVTEKENVEEMWYCPALKMYISVNECKGCLDYFDCHDSKANENR